MELEKGIISWTKTVYFCSAVNQHIPNNFIMCERKSNTNKLNRDAFGQFVCCFLAEYLISTPCLALNYPVPFVIGSSRKTYIE